jgi:hypothetical protein
MSRHLRSPLLQLPSQPTWKQIWKLRKEITAVIENANPQRGDEVVVLLNSSGGAVSSYGLAAAQLERVKVSGSCRDRFSDLLLALGRRTAANSLHR